MECHNTYFPYISQLLSSVAFLTSFVSLFPQIIETYHDKTVAGLSVYFLICWLLADITTLGGALLTDQMMFQVLLALYFLANDTFMLCQYWYYGVYHNNELAQNIADKLHAEEEECLLSRTNSRISGTFASNSAAYGAIVAANIISTTQALYIPQGYSSSYTTLEDADPTLPPSGALHMSSLGGILSWLGAMLYVGARIPQLIKNYRRKSTDGISPWLFITTLVGNIGYSGSIFTGCTFLDSDDKVGYIHRALPFIVGSSGTIVFDLFYFYQHYFLYNNQLGPEDLAALEEYEHEHHAHHQQTPLAVVPSI